jgi:hypothetical protein
LTRHRQSEELVLLYEILNLARKFELLIIDFSGDRIKEPYLEKMFFRDGWCGKML